MLRRIGVKVDAPLMHGDQADTWQPKENQLNSKP
jgi:hypothetical protein